MACVCGVRCLLFLSPSCPHKLSTPISCTQHGNYNYEQAAEEGKGNVGFLAYFLLGKLEVRACMWACINTQG